MCASAAACIPTAPVWQDYVSDVLLRLGEDSDNDFDGCIGSDSDEESAGKVQV